VIDDESWDGGFGRFQFEAELLLYSAEDVGRAVRRAWLFPTMTPPPENRANGLCPVFRTGF
jgi:hypothetical protein